MKGRRVKVTLLVGITAIVLGTAALWFLVVSPRLNEAMDISNQTDQVAMSNSTLRTQHSNLIRQAKAAPAEAAELQTLLQRIPSQADLPSIIRQITDAASNAGIGPEGIRNIGTSLPEAVDPGVNPDGTPKSASVDLARIQVSIDAVGTPAQIVKLSKAIDSLPRAMLVTRTNYQWLTQPGKPPQMSAQIEGQMFLLRSQVTDMVARVNDLLAQATKAAS